MSNDEPITRRAREIAEGGCFSKGRLRDELRMKPTPGAEPAKWYKDTYGGRFTVYRIIDCAHIQEIGKPDDIAVHALCHVSLSTLPTTPAASLSAWSIFVPRHCGQAFQRLGLKITTTLGHPPSSLLLLRMNQTTADMAKRDVFVQWIRVYFVEGFPEADRAGGMTGDKACKYGPIRVITGSDNDFQNLFHHPGMDFLMLQVV